MQKIITTHASAKYQVTIPKEAREALGIKDSSEPLGFIIDKEKHLVKLSRVNIVTSEDELSEEDYQKLIQLADRPGGKLFTTAEEAASYHKKLTKRK